MKMRKSNAWLYIFISFLVSLVVFITLGYFVKPGDNALFGFSGVLVAGAWSFLNIETNKEISRKEEFVNFFNDYEESVLSFVLEARVFLQRYRDFHLFEYGRQVKSTEINEMIVSEESVDIVRKRMKDYEEEYLKGQGILLYRDLVNQKNELKYKFKVLSMRSEVVKVLGVEFRVLNSIERLGGEVVRLFSKEIKLERSIKGELYNLDKDFGLIEIEENLKNIVVDKVRGFEDRNSEYEDNKNLALFYISLGVFLSLWEVMY